jgi:hypothetical protein
MRESRLYGFVRGALSNERPYRVGIAEFIIGAHSRDPLTHAGYLAERINASSRVAR